ncbi:Putative transcriptional regulator of 2-aminoethylphosphonate degradation operons [Burkholderia cepacia]|nr:Putative transcriptional regulator of 2-aminoethylphosphonate degradation operons [Burkholderia cepacia]
MNPSSPAERKGVALYARIASLLRGRIHQGEWKRGDQLPPIPELCAFYRAGTITVRQALAELSAEGLVSSARGRGTFVTADVLSPPDNPALRAAINDPLQLAPGQTLRVLLREAVTALPAALQTGQPMRAAYMRIRTLQLHDGAPYGVMDSYVARKPTTGFRRAATRGARSAISSVNTTVFRSRRPARKSRPPMRTRRRPTCSRRTVPISAWPTC